MKIITSTKFQDIFKESEVDGDMARIIIDVTPEELKQIERMVKKSEKNTP